MTCLSAVLPFLFACASLLLVALAALLVQQSSELSNRSDLVFGAVILVVALLVFVVSSVSVYFKYKEPADSSLSEGSASNLWLLWLERVAVLAVGAVILVLASIVIHNESAAPSPPGTQPTSNTSFAAVILAAACLVVLVSAINIVWRLLPLCQRGWSTSSEVATKSFPGFRTEV